MQVAELAVKRGFLEAVILVRILLIILSTRLGTLLLCGTLCFGEKWPYINKFSDIPVENREKVIQKWFKHRFLTPIRLPFVFIKFLCLYAFFTQVMAFPAGLVSDQADIFQFCSYILKFAYMIFLLGQVNRESK